MPTPSFQEHLVVRSLLLAALAMSAACGDAPPSTQVSDPDAYLDELPAYPEPPEPFDRSTGGAQVRPHRRCRMQHDDLRNR